MMASDFGGVANVDSRVSAAVRPLSTPCRSSPVPAGRKRTGSYEADDRGKWTFAVAHLAAAFDPTSVITRSDAQS